MSCPRGEKFHSLPRQYPLIKLIRVSLVPNLEKRRQALKSTEDMQTPTEVAEPQVPVTRAEEKATELDKALKAANAAYEDAENSLKNVENLPSARLPTEVPGIVKVGTWAAQFGFLVTLMVASHSLGPLARLVSGSLAGIGLGWLGYRKGSLSLSGGIGAALIGGATFSASLRASLVLFTFYWTSSKLTTYCEDRKLDDESFKTGGQRDWKQVACNGFVPAALAILAMWQSGGRDLPLATPALGLLEVNLYTPLTAGLLGYFACCCGDTWASEVGQLSDDTPRLITTLRPVRKGTNGGVTILGLLASALGGLCIGTTFYFGSLLSPSIFRNNALWNAALQQWLVIPLGLTAGLVGSFIDSVLGSTLQFTGYNRTTGKITSKESKEVTKISGLSFLSNNAVNLVSACCTAMLSALLARPLLATALLV